jgi:hypothetical protein
MSVLYRIGLLERLPLKTPYPAVVARIGAIIAQLPRGSALACDYTGVGRGIFDMLQFRGVTPIGITLTGGDSVHWTGGNATVPKSTLVSRLVALVHSGELVVHKQIKDWPILRRELLNFRTEVTPGGQTTWNAIPGAHDDLVIAVALASFMLEGRDIPSFGAFEYARQRAFEINGMAAPERYAMGVDIGQARDPTAICVMSRVDYPATSDAADFVR